MDVRGDVSRQDLIRLLSLVDLTSLTGNETNERIDDLCAFARSPSPESGAPPVAALCTFPAFVRIAKSHLAATPVRVASVTASFPEAPATTEMLVSEITAAIREGADEIDLVMNRDAFLQSRPQIAGEQIALAKSLCGDRVLKVILETALLESDEMVFGAAMLAMRSGADFVKTSTGKKGAATPQHIRTMSMAIRDFFGESGRRVGIKPAGGISTAAQAIDCLNAVKNVLGEEWINPSLFRFGTSSLARNVVQAINGEPGLRQSNGQY